ncbi:hypothetical protein JZ751_014820 [Albula glossodonta]|uniref:Uncharacterized protein n=1 Tax=Albula glossodonta TaxID=121402 RepID=A0A8T2N2P7_9TELE|nr:hypothetical protein JZ751_014820 [Albula glossodonta]
MAACFEDLSLPGTCRNRTACLPMGAAKELGVTDLTLPLMGAAGVELQFGPVDEGGGYMVLWGGGNWVGIFGMAIEWRKLAQIGNAMLNLHGPLFLKMKTLSKVMFPRRLLEEGASGHSG